MTSLSDPFFHRLVDFTQESMQWCRKESETGIYKINSILQLIMENGKRVSAISQETLDAIEKMQLVVEHLGKAERSSANTLGLTIKNIATQDTQMNQFISPVIETLQFQDRIAQKMNNLSKMLESWRQYRKTLEDTPGQATPKELQDFGDILLKHTCMKEERDIIHRHIKGLKQEVQEETTVLFF